MEKRTLITGAGGGLGKEFAYLFANDKNGLCLVDIDAKGLDDTEAYVLEKVPGTRIDKIVADLSNKEDLK